MYKNVWISGNRGRRQGLLKNARKKNRSLVVIRDQYMRRRIFMSLEKLFHLKENHTDVKTEVLAGITTFMTMAYILAVNPGILGATGMDSGAVFTATAVSALFCYFMYGIYGKLPICTCTRYGLKTLTLLIP